MTVAWVNRSGKVAVMVYLGKRLFTVAAKRPARATPPVGPTSLYWLNTDGYAAVVFNPFRWLIILAVKYRAGPKPGIRCPGCDRVVPKTARFCAYCGEYLGGSQFHGDRCDYV